MKISKITSLLFTTLLTSSLANAYQSNLNIHTWHVITAKNGQWNGSLNPLNEKSYFVKRDGSVIKNISVNPANPVEYGFTFDASADFDIAYTITLIEQTTKSFVSKACVFVVTAKGPANPDIQALNYNGATCSYKVVPGVGEDFFVS